MALDADISLTNKRANQKRLQDVCAHVQSFNDKKLGFVNTFLEKKLFKDQSTVSRGKEANSNVYIYI